VRRCVLSLWLVVACLECAGQVTPGTPGQPAFTCTANAGAPVIVRVEGITELVGDLLLQCTGGQPTAAGQFVPQTNLRLTLNTNITSRLLNPMTGASEAMLLIDEPGSAKNPAPQLVCGAPGSNVNVNGACPVPGNGTGVDVYNGSAGHPNIYVARQVDPSTLEWDGVPIDPPGTNGVRLVRLTNVRANASQLGLSSTLIPTQIVGFVGVTGGQFFTINNPQQMLASVQQGLVAGTNNGLARKDCEDTNASFLQGIIPNPILVSNVNVREGFAQSFKRQLFGTNVNLDPTQSHAGSESGFWNSNFPNVQGYGNLGAAGSAGFGTRIMLRFNNVGNGVRVVLPGVVPLTTGNGQQTGSLQFSSGGTPVPGLSSYRFLDSGAVAGSASAVYEVVNSDPSAIEQANIPVAMAFIGAQVRGQIGQGTITATVGWAAGYIPLLGTSDLPPNVAALLQLQAATPGVAANGLVLPNANPAFTLSSVRGCPDQQGLMTAVVPNSFNAPVLFNTYQSNITVPQVFNYGIAAPDIQVNNMFAGANADPQPHNTNAVVTSNWLSVELNEANTPATASISVNPAGLAAGAYTGTVTINSTQSVNGLSIPVRLNVLAPGPLFFGPGITNAGSYVNNVVSPGEAVVIFGERFGPAALAGAVLGADGKLTTNIGNTRVLFDGVAAPLYYAVAGQVAAFAPFSLAGKTSTQVQVEYNGVKSPLVQIPVLNAVPSLFTADGSGGGQGAILNQDQSFNSVTPESPGNYVVLYGTGAGQTNPGGRDGALAGVGGALGTFLLPIKVFIDGQPATDIAYSGPAPSLVEGVFQVNVRIPANVRRNANLPVIVQVGDKLTQQGVTIAVR
jgi:uncharacterized protein (TIGR03437 family)